MAGKKQDKYESALQSISDFIFKNSGKRPKLKPLRPSGSIEGTDALATQLAELATKPGVFISDALMRSINDTIGSQAWMQFYVDKLDSQKHTGADPDEGRFRVRGQETTSLIANPRKYVQDVYTKAKAERAWAAKVGFAGYVDGAIAWNWGKRTLGLDSKEAARLFTSTAYDLTELDREDAHKLTAETAAYEAYKDKGKAKSASEDLYRALNSSSLTRSSKASITAGVMGREYIQTLSGSQRAPIEAINTKVKAGTPLSVDEQNALNQFNAQAAKFATSKNVFNERYKQMQNHLAGIKDGTGKNRYTKAEIENLLDRYVDARDLSKLSFTAGEREDGAIDKFTNLNPTSYRRMLMRNYEAKLANLDPVVDKAEFEKYAKAAGAIGMFQRAYGHTTLDDYDVLKDKISNDLNSPGVNSVRQAELKKILGRLEKEVDFFKNNRGANGLTRLEILSTVNAVPKLGQMRGDLERYINLETDYWQSKYKELVKLSAAGPLTSSQQNELLTATKRLDVLTTEKQALKTLPFMGTRVTVGQVFGMMRSYQALMQGGAANMIFNGNFFVQDIAGPLAPGAFGNIFVYNGKGENDFFKVFGVLPRSDLNPAYAGLASLYYASPSAIMKTLWDGSGFAFAANTRQNAARKILQSYEKEIISVLGITSKDFGEKVSGNYLQLLDDLKKLNNPIISKFLGRVDKLTVTAEKMGNIANFINTNFAGRFAKSFEKLRTKLLGAVGNFLKGKTINAGWNKAVDGFVAGTIGMKELIRAGVTAILQALNITVSGGTLSIIVGAVSYFVTEVIYKAFKPVLEVLASMFSLLAIIIFGLIILLVGAGSNFFASKTSPYRSYYPGSALACIESSPYAYLYPTENVPTFGSGDVPPDSICPFKAQPVNCSQGGRASIASNFHKTRTSFDASTIQTWYAPSDGNVVLYNPVNFTCRDGSNTGGELHFVDSEGNKYILIHVNAIAGKGPVSKGKPVAVAQTSIPNSSPDCWTGPHYHLDVMVNDKFVDSVLWYRDGLKCNINTNYSAHCAGY